MSSFNLITPQFTQGRQILPAQDVSTINMTDYLTQVYDYINKNNNTAYSLNFSGMTFCELIIPLIKYLSRFTITELDMSYTSDHLFDIVRLFPSLRSLVLIQSQLNSQFDRIFELRFKTLKFINLSCNRLNKRQLSALLGKQSVVQPVGLILQECELDNELLYQIYIPNLQYLYLLDLSDNRFESTEYIVKVLYNCKYIVNFQLRNTRITSCSYKELFSAINVGVEALDLYGSLDAYNAVALSSVLERFQQLTQLRIGLCDFSNAGKVLSDALQQIPQLKFVDCRYSGATLDGVRGDVVVIY